jgi:membrane-associated PAP2 superfamily phosphatase
LVLFPIGFIELLPEKSVPLKNIILVFICFTGASAISHQSGLDYWLAHKIYLLEGGVGTGFPWKHNFWLDKVIHEGGRTLAKCLFFLDLAMFAGSYFIQKLKTYRYIFLFIALAGLFSTALISSLKHFTTLSCPDTLVEFGGDRQWVDIWQLFSSDLPQGNCYPAGHASAGYAWLCLAFIFPYRSKSFYWSLVPGTLLGICFGVAQQLRGLHFLSHDLLTIALCWLISGAIFYLMRWVSGHKNYFDESCFDKP